MPVKTSCPQSTAVFLLRQGRLPEPQASDLRRHLEDCPECSRRHAPVPAPEDDPAASADIVAATLNPEPAARPTICPVCSARLRSMLERSWCTQCGFTSDGAAAPMVVAMQRRSLLPFWALVLVAGVGGLIWANVNHRELLPEAHTSIIWWVFGQAGAGVAVYLIAHVWTIVAALGVWRENEVFKYLDPMTVWKYAFECLPKTRIPLCLGAWGATAFACAGVVFWEYDFAFKDRLNKKANTLGAMKVKTTDDPGLLDVLVADDELGGDEDEADKRDVHLFDELFNGEPPEKERPHVAECVVIGYVPDPNDPERIGQLVLGVRGEDGSIQYAGTVDAFAKVDGLEQWVAQVKQQPPLLEAPAYLPGNLKAIPIAPKLSCRIGYAERNKAGVLKDPIVKGITQPGGDDKKDAADRP